MTSSDDALVKLLAAGDQDALAELYDRYSAMMVGVAVRLLNNNRDAEDLVHDVFIEAWQKASSFDPTRGTVRSWLMVRLRSRAADRRRTLSTARARAVLLVASESTEEELSTLR